MAIVASIIAVVMGFAAALLLYEATAQVPRDGRPAEGGRRDRLRRLGFGAAAVAVVAAYVAALS
jgi:hypothetical protein